MQLFGEDADVASMHSYVLELESEENLVYKNPQTSRQGDTQHQPITFIYEWCGECTS